MVGGRDNKYAMAFMDDLQSRLSNRVQFTTDGHKAYLEAIEEAFGGDIDYAMLVKQYVTPKNAGKSHQHKYSPAECIGAKKVKLSGEPEKKLVSTSHVERQNLTMRMHMRRFTRLTNAFSKKVNNHQHAVVLHFMFYNFVRVHRTLRVTPAMQVGITDRLWAIEGIVGLIDVAAPAPKKLGPYKTKKKIQTDPLPPRLIALIAL